MDYNPKFLGALKEALLPYTSAPSWLVAYSGGMDSHALLFALNQLRLEDSTLPPLRAIHINHGLQENAKAMQSHCACACLDLSIPFETVDVDIALSKKQESR